LSEEKNIVATLEEALNLKEMTLAIQTQFGLDPVRMYASLMISDEEGKLCGVDRATGEVKRSLAAPDPTAPAPAAPVASTANKRRFRFLASGSSDHTGPFVVDCTSTPGAELRDFVDVLALDIIGVLEPYAAAIAQFKTFHEQKMSGGGDIRVLRAVVERRLKRELAGGGDNEIDVAALYNLMGISYLMMRDTKEAVAQFERASEYAPEFGLADLNFALLRVMEKRPDDALALTAKAIRAPIIAASPVLIANVHTVEALALWQKGDHAGASANLLRAVQSYPGSFFAYYYWSELARSLGNLDDAALLRKRAETHLATNATYPELGLLYFLAHPGKEGELNFRLVNTENVRSVGQLEAQSGG
jgi:tetratricopeptide (TPR) repeat protein